MTHLQVSTLWSCAVPPGQVAETRQTRWLLARGLVRKRKGLHVATRAGKRVLLHQTAGWITVSPEAYEAIAASLRRRRA